MNLKSSRFVSFLRRLFGRKPQEASVKPSAPAPLAMVGPSPVPPAPQWSAPQGATTKPASKLQLPSKSKTETLDPVFYMLSDEDVRVMPICEQSEYVASKA